MKKRRIHIIVAALVFGTLLWLSVTLRESYQITLAVPLTLEEVPRGMAVRTSIPRTLTVRLRGDGWRLIGLLWGPTRRTALSLGSFPAENGKVVFKDFADRFSFGSDIRLVDVKPESIVVHLDRSMEKKIPVLLDGTFLFREGYGLVGEPVVAPESVTVGGAETVVNRVTGWKTEHRTFEDLRTSVDVPVDLAQSTEYALYLTPPQVQVRATVEPFAEKIFTGIVVEVQSLPQNRDVIFIPPKLEIVARGGIRQLAGIVPTDFLVTVDFERLLSDTTGKIDPLVQAPSGIHVVSKKPERLQYIIRTRQ